MSSLWWEEGVQFLPGAAGQQFTLGGCWIKRATGGGLARYLLFQISAQILEDVLLTLLYFEQNGLRHPSVVLPRMNFARLQEDSPQIGDALLREQHLVFSLNQLNSNSHNTAFSKVRRNRGPPALEATKENANCCPTRRHSDF
jgi:hypothetical protein